MKIVSFNVNGLRARLHQLQALIDEHRPDLIALQETKVHDSQFPRLEVEAMGYHVCFHGQKAHYGVALLSRQEPLSWGCGFDGDGEEAQRRLIYGRYAFGERILILVNGYFPQGEGQDHPVKFPAKEKFYADLLQLLGGYDPQRDLLAVVGDMNVAPADPDVGIGAENEKRWLKAGKSGFLPEERRWLRRLLDWGLQDSYRCCCPQGTDLSWFDYRSRGFEQQPKRGLRIDLILTSAALQPLCAAAGIDYGIRGMEKPSDHCPIWAEFEL
ncbi:MAG: exodeoxyribonuclease III [Desulfuromonadaceae bacterium]|nr:exodeoxyribonuclease III [Desulfuromonadaceae bacterium]